MSAVLPESPRPAFYRETLSERVRFSASHRVGNPFALLNGVGIVPIIEFIYKGNNLLDVARELDIPATYLFRWVEEEGHGQAVEEAERVSAEGFLSTAHRLLWEARDKFEVGKAKELLSHARFMASKLDKGTYGNDNQVQAGTGVQFVFNIGEGQQTVDLNALQAASGPIPLEGRHGTTYENTVDSAKLLAPDPVEGPSGEEDPLSLGPFVELGKPMDIDELDTNAMPDYLQ